MSNEKRGFQGGIRVKPNAELTTKAGEINISSTDSKVKVTTEVPADFNDSVTYSVGDKVRYTDEVNYICIQETTDPQFQNPSDELYWKIYERSIVTEDQVQTLENKTIDGTSSGNNTVTIDASSAIYDNSSSGLVATDSQAAIDEIEGRVDTLETDLDSHVNSVGTVHTATAISFDNAASGMSATTSQGAFDELDGRLDTVETDLSSAQGDITDLETLSGSSGSVDHGIFSGDTIPDNSTTKAALQALETEVEVKADDADLTTHINDTSAHGVSGSVVGTSDSQTLTNKAVNANDNTLNGLYPSSFVLSKPDGSIHESTFAGGSKPIPSGDVVGTSDSQTLTNKTIQGASIQDPSRLDAKKDTFTNLETYAASAADGQIVFATDTKQTFVIKDNALSEFSGGGSGSGDLNSIPLDLASFTGNDTLRAISSNRSFNITSGTLNVNHINGFTDSLNVSSISSKFLDKDLELVMSFRSSSTPDSISVIANGNTFELTNDGSITYSGNKWDTQLPDMPSEELVFDIGQLGSESTTIQLSYTDQASTHYTNAYQGVHFGDNENIQNEAYFDSYSSSYYNRTFIASANGYTIVRDTGITEIPDDVNVSPNNFFTDRVYFSAIGATSVVRVDEVNGRGFFAQGQVIAASNNPNTALGSFSTYGNSPTLNGNVADMFAHDGEMLVCAGSLYYSTDTSISSGLGLQINSSILGSKRVTRDPISGLWYVCNNAGEVYELDSVFDTSPTLLNTFASVEGLAAYDGRIWVAHDSGVDVIGYGPIVSGSFTDVKFDVRSNIVYATTAGNLYGCAYSANSMELLRAVGQFSGSMKLSCYSARNSSQGTLTASQSDKVYIVEQNADGFMVIHGSPTSQIADMSIRIKEDKSEVTFQHLANSSTGVQTITQGNFATREINSQIGESSFMSLSANQINLKRGKYLVEYKAQQYGGEGYVALQGTSSGTLTITNGESSNIIGHVSGTSIVGWHHCSALVDVDADDADIYFLHFADASEVNSTLTGYAPRATPSVPIFEAKVTKV